MHSIKFVKEHYNRKSIKRKIHVKKGEPFMCTDLSSYILKEMQF